MFTLNKKASGGLKVFWLMNIFKFIQFPVMLLLIVLALAFFPDEAQLSPLIFFYYVLLGVYFIFSYFILRLFKINKVFAIKKIRLYLFLEIAVMSFWWLLYTVLLNKDLIFKEYDILAWGFIYFIIWNIYFKNSEQVKCYWVKDTQNYII